MINASSSRRRRRALQLFCALALAVLACEALARFWPWPPLALRPPRSTAAFTIHPALIVVGSRASARAEQHELGHVAQMRRDGWLRFMLRYATSTAWRDHYEQTAY